MPPPTAIDDPNHGLQVEEESNCNSQCGNEIPPMIVSTFEEMNPNRRDTMEDCHVVHAPATWRAVDPTLAYFGVYDGHGGREMVDYLEYFLAFHVGGELNHDDDASMETRLERAFLLADIHAVQCGVSSSGSTVAVCLIKVRVGVPTHSRLLN
jgi:serine/threonine protein phosphatase PrpC